jgi:hypothetical protein
VNSGLRFHSYRCIDCSTAGLRAASMARPIAGAIALRSTTEKVVSGNGNQAWSHSGEGIA